MRALCPPLKAVVGFGEGLAAPPADQVSGPLGAQGGAQGFIRFYKVKRA